MIKYTILLDEGDVDVLYNMTPLHDGSVEGALTNGIINQIIIQEGEQKDLGLQGLFLR